MTRLGRTSMNEGHPSSAVAGWPLCPPERAAHQFEITTQAT